MEKAALLPKSVFDRNIFDAVMDDVKREEVKPCVMKIVDPCKEEAQIWVAFSVLSILTVVLKPAGPRTPRLLMCV